MSQLVGGDHAWPRSRVRPRNIGSLPSNIASVHLIMLTWAVGSVLSARISSECAMHVIKCISKWLIKWKTAPVNNWDITNETSKKNKTTTSNQLWSNCVVTGVAVSSYHDNLQCHQWHSCPGTVVPLTFPIEINTIIIIIIIVIIISLSLLLISLSSSLLLSLLLLLLLLLLLFIVIIIIVIIIVVVFWYMRRDVVLAS